MQKIIKIYPCLLKLSRKQESVTDGQTDRRPLNITISPHRYRGGIKTFWNCLHCFKISIRCKISTLHIIIFLTHSFCIAEFTKLSVLSVRTDTRLVFCNRKLMRTDIFFIRTTKSTFKFVNTGIAIKITIPFLLYLLT